MKKFKSYVSFLGEFIYSLVLELGLYMSSVLILAVLAVKHYEVEISVPTIQIEEGSMLAIKIILFMAAMIGLLYWLCPNPSDEDKSDKLIESTTKK